jgi:hypothetical protein
VCLLDAKTSGFIPTKHHVQIAGYDRLADASGFGRADRCSSSRSRHGRLRAAPGARRPTRTSSTPSHVYRRAGMIGREAGKDRKQREAVAA